MRLIVCGGRNYNDAETISMALHAVRTLRGPIAALIHGDARGVDTIAGKWARENGIEEVPFPADWIAHGNSAGPIRNQKMIDEGKPDRVVAFPGGAGTADMVRRARKARIAVWEVNPKTREIHTLDQAELLTAENN